MKGLLASAAIALLALAPSPARAADGKVTEATSSQSSKAACSDAYEQTQTSRAAGQLRRSREQALICSQSACPAVLSADCVRWLAEIESSQPTVVVEAKDATGRETTQVKVTVDGELVSERVDGRAFAIDPGVRVVRFEVAGEPAKEERVVIRQGEKNRKLSVSFAASAPRAGSPAQAEPGGRSPIVYVIGGLGVAGIAAFATLGIIGKSEQGDLEASCMPACSADRVASVRTKFNAADVALGVGVVSLGVATVLWFTTAPSRPARGGASVARARPAAAPPVAQLRF